MSLNEGVTGATSSGILSQMIALGAMNAYINKGATVSFFRFRYNRHTNFAFESVQQPFGSAVQFGQQAEIVLNRAGDLIYFMYVVIELPGIIALR